MSRNEVSNNLINHYLESQESKYPSLKSLRTTKKSGQSLKNFYSEVQTQNINYTIHNVYNGKSAVEIEIIMMRNRQLIEANHTKR
ncbi:MAG: hypothetical protein PHV62_09635 [Sulfuricurvum sp.]|nr:hypothetical protein [Sulfuricurvum sp.]